MTAVTSDTIFALATPPGRAALALVRISGPRSVPVVSELTGKPCPPPRQASLRDILDPEDREMIDQGIVTYFAGPASFTGEDSVEIAVHGGRGVVTALVRAIGRCTGMRPAEQGEFTKRAFLNGKLDLTQAEAIADLIDSETEFQRRQALRILDGALGRMVERWRSMVLDIAAELESILDFSDEYDVQERGSLRSAAACAALEREMQQEVDKASRSRALREGFTIVVAGPPNVGKSTLFNLLVGRDAAIVTDIPGTTRDLIEARLDLAGAPAVLVDSAGIRDAVDVVEQIGIARSLSAAGTADLVVWLRNSDANEDPPAVGCPILQVWSKSDIHAGPPEMLAISADRPETIEQLQAVVRGRIVDVLGDGSEGVLIRERHIQAMSRCVAALGSLGGNIDADMIELAAEDCRRVCDELGALNGRILAEDVLSEIFQRFCIGK